MASNTNPERGHQIKHGPQGEIKIILAAPGINIGGENGIEIEKDLTGRAVKIVVPGAISPSQERSRRREIVQNAHSRPFIHPEYQEP